MRIRRVEHRRLHRSAEDRLRVAHDIGVEWIVTRDEDGEALLAAPTGTTGLLPHGCTGTGPPAQQHSVEPGDVDAEFKR